MPRPQDDQPRNANSTPPAGRASSSLDEHFRVAPPRLDVPATLSVGAVLFSRFRILRVLGRGGMGEVYEAEDLELRERVAIKTLLPHIAENEHSLERFRREVQLARRVGHPNVCRVFEVFRHTMAPSAEGAASGSLLFMTMEMLPGQPLALYLGSRRSDAASSPGKSSPPFTAQEALPLIEQMASALDAAHAIGIVHRDFKPGNVMLVPQTGNSALRAVVTDFGLARFAAGESEAAMSFTGRDEKVGTPAYMAPEQVAGEEITAATDVYALGLVIYEMVTGVRPFGADTPEVTQNKRLREKPAPPKSLVPSLDARWNEVILNCLERRPADRFNSAGKVVAALRGEPFLTAMQRRHIRRSLLAVTAGLIISLAGVAIYRFWPSSKPKVAGQRSIAVVRLANLSEQAGKKWIGNSLEGTLTRDLSASEKLRVKSIADVSFALQNAGIPESGPLDDAAISRIAGDLRSEILVLGQYETSGMPGNPEVRVTLRIVDSAQTSQQPPIVEVGRENDLFTLNDRLGQDLRTRLGLHEAADAVHNQVRAAFSSDPLANRAYFEGLDRLRQFDPLGARDLFREAIAKDPKAPLPHAALSEAWNILGYDADAVAEAKKAQETSQGLSRPEQVEIECRALELARADWDDTFRSCQGVWNLRKNLDSGLRLAEVQFTTQRWPDSLRTLDLLRQNLPEQDRDDPRIDILEARVRDQLTAHPEMLKAAESAETKARDRGARLLEAQAQLWKCVAQQNLDHLKEAQDSCTAANGVYYAVGDKIGQARAVTNLAHVLLKLDDPAAAKKYDEALRLASSVGSKRDICDALLNYGAALLDRHNLVAATLRLRESWKVGMESQNQGCQARALENLGLVAKAQRDFKTARQNFTDAAKTYGGLQMTADAARIESNTGDLLSRQGDPAAAIPLLKDAAARREQLGLIDLLGLTLLALGDAQLAQADVDGALVSYQRAQQIQENLKESQDAATTKIFVSQALLEKGDSAQAESLVRTAAAWFADKSDPDDQASAHDQLVQALLAQGKNEEAAREAHSLQTLLDHSTAKNDGQQAIQEETRISARIAIARVTVLSSASMQGIAVLSSIASEARRQQFLLQECRAQLFIAEARKARSLPLDRQELTRLQRQAQSKGLLLLAHKLNRLS